MDQSVLPVTKHKFINGACKYPYTNWELTAIVLLPDWDFVNHIPHHVMVN